MIQILCYTRNNNTFTLSCFPENIIKLLMFNSRLIPLQPISDLLTGLSDTKSISVQLSGVPSTSVYNSCLALYVKPL